MAAIEVLCLSAEEIQSLITGEEVLAATEEVYRQVGLGKIVCPVKVSLPLIKNLECLSR
jgi:hypothetical protein